jgi:hypothetical protein
MALKVPAFSGMTPLVAPHLLDPTKAQQATNTKLNRGDLRAFKDTLAVLTLAAGPAPTTIYRYPESGSLDTQYWFQWTDDVDVVRSPIADDDWERVYWSGETTGGADYARYTKNDIATTGAPYPSTRRRLGVPAPDTAPAHSVSGSPTDPDSLNLTVVYAVTFVTDVGEEGPISPLSTEVTYKLGQSIDLSSIPVAPPVAWTGLLNITSKRIYRSATGTDATDLQFVAELPLATSTYSDTKAQSGLGEVCPSKHWEPPPEGLRGLTMGANGVAAGFVGATAYFSETFLPHAWNTENAQSLEYPIIAVGALPQGFVFATKGQPYLLEGADASSMTVTKLPNKQGCVSKRSLVEMEGFVVYASPDGLVVVDGGGAKLITEGILSREEWQAYVPSSIKAWQYDGRYYASFDTGSRKGILVFDFADARPDFVEVDLAPWVVKAGYYDASRDGLYLCVQQGTDPAQIRRFDAGASYLSYLWRSKLVLSPRPINPACCHVEGDFENGAVTFKLYAWNDTNSVFDLKITKTVSSPDPFWLPAGYLATKFYFELSGTSAVRYVILGESLDQVSSGQ